MNIHRSLSGEYQHASDIAVEYGIAVEVAESIRKVSRLWFTIWTGNTDNKANRKHDQYLLFIVTKYTAGLPMNLEQKFEA